MTMLFPMLAGSSCICCCSSRVRSRRSGNIDGGDASVIGTLVDRDDSSLFHMWLYLRVNAFLWSKAIRGEPRAAHLKQAECHTGVSATAENFRARPRRCLP